MISWRKLFAGPRRNRSGADRDFFRYVRYGMYMSKAVVPVAGPVANINVCVQMWSCIYTEQRRCSKRMRAGQHQQDSVIAWGRGWWGWGSIVGVGKSIWTQCSRAVVMTSCCLCQTDEEDSFLENVGNGVNA